jgi:hypothetical protein
MTLETLGVVIAALAFLVALRTAARATELRYRAWGWELRWRAQVAETRGERQRAEDFDTVSRHNFELAGRWRRIARLGLGR